MTRTTNTGYENGIYTFLTNKKGNDKPRIFKSRLFRDNETKKNSGFLDFILNLLNIDRIARIDPILKLTIYEYYNMKHGRKY